MTVRWREYFNKERQVRALVRRSGIARPRIAALTSRLMARQPAGSPGLLAAVTTPANVRAIVAALTVLEAKLEYDKSAVSSRGQRIATDDLATIKDALK